MSKKFKRISFPTEKVRIWQLDVNSIELPDLAHSMYQTTVSGRTPHTRYAVSIGMNDKRLFNRLMKNIRGALD